ncbi:YsnF/AvaK domain-containing protein [Sphingomonas solaris]|uniref:DUF2382 domain-containing protein n=1 Tax=Alterirhizorhabdus solaris TaxID=2529389 RepID=A0A558RDB6_9SPHN|nr:DUF2382 domain-containing protein [Sphingomonas solaris]TVV77344.1 DUF2382 domain-containing protein [Sphingomonas solaris]
MAGEQTDEDQSVRIPTMEERLHLTRERVETGRVRISSTVRTEQVAVDEELTSTSVCVERVPVDILVDVAPQIRTEGDRTIMPVVEEVMVKRFRIIEEVHLIREMTIDRYKEDVSLRRQDIAVARIDVDQPAGSKDGQAS